MAQEVRLNHTERGNGPAVLCVHGAGTYGETWWPSMQPVLEAGRRVIAYDRRGYGENPGSPASRITDHVDDAAALLSELDTGPATVVGMSAAGPIVLALAIEHPELVSSIVLAEPAYQMVLCPSLSANGAIAAVELRRMLGKPEAAALGFYHWASAHMSGGNGYDDLPDDWKKIAIGHGPAVFRELAQLIAPWPRARDVAAIKCPVTLVKADNGQPVFRRTTERVARLLPDANRAEINGAGHLIPTDKPAEFGAIVAAAIA